MFNTNLNHYNLASKEDADVALNPSRIISKSSPSVFNGRCYITTVTAINDYVDLCCFGGFRPLNAR